MTGRGWSMLVGLGAALLAGISAAGVMPGPFDAGRPRWHQLEFKASKLLLTATARVEAGLRPGGEIAGELASTPQGLPVPAGPVVLEMIYTAHGLGRDSVTTLWADPVSGAALQRGQLDTGGSQRQRVYRFTDSGAYHFTRRPAGSREKRLEPDQWTDNSEGMRPFPASTRGRPVTEPTALLWLVAAADLDKPGDQLEVFTFSRRHVHRVIIEVTGQKSVRVDFSESGAGGARQRRGDMSVLVMQLRGMPVDQDTDDDEPFELLGLRGDLELLVDPVSRTPLQLRGKIKVLGDLTVRLQAVSLL